MLRSACVGCVFVVAACQSAGGNPTARAMRANDQVAAYSANYTMSTAAEFDVSGDGADRSARAAALDDADDPADAIAHVVCEKKLVCGGIGAGAGFLSMQSCKGEAARLARKALEALDCDNGLREDALTRCRAALWSGPCTSSLDAIGSEACPRAGMCI